MKKLKKQPLNEQFVRMQKLAGIITENQMSESPIFNVPGISPSYQDGELPLNPEVAEYIDKTVEGAIGRGDMEKLKRVGYWEGDFPDYLLDEFGDDYDAYKLSKQVKDYIDNKVY